MKSASPESRVICTLQLVNEWLRFAEVKNGALITLNAAAVVATHQLRDWYKPVPDWVSYWSWAATLLFLAAIAVGLASFYSRTKTFGFDLPRHTAGKGGNALFFGHLADMSRTDVLARLVDQRDVDREDRYLEDVAEQIIINAKIARKKFALFNFALMLTMAGALTPVGWLLYHWGFCNERL